MKLFYISLGMIVIGLSLLLYLTAFIIVPLVSPEGSYPMTLGFIPALPLIWLSWTLIKKGRITPLKCDALSVEGKAQEMAL